MRSSFYTLIALLSLCFGTLDPAYAQPTDWLPRGIGGGGAFFSPSINPHNLDEVYLPSDMTDLFHTTDLGRKWTVVPFQEIRAFPETLVQFTSDPNVRYTLRVDFANDLRVPAKSTDGGRTWTPLANDSTNGEAYYLRADESATNRLVVSDYCNIYYSGDGGATFAPIYETSCDFGAPIVGAFWDGNTIVVATILGLLVSTDGGTTFNLQNLNGIPSDEGLVSFAGARQGGTTRFVAVTTGQGDFWPGASAVEHWGYRGVYTMDFGASNWTRRTSGIGSDDHPFYVGMAKDNVDVAYLAGSDADLAYPIVLKTTDGGTSWQHVFQTVGNQNITTGWSGYQGDEDWWYDEVSLGFTVASTDPDRVIITGFGFAHVTTDGGQTWRQMYVAPADENPAGAPTPKGKAYRSIGLENTSAWWLTWSGPSDVFAGYADIMAVRSTDGGTSWSKGYDAPEYNSIYHVLQDPSDGTLYAAASSVHDLYQSHRLEDDPIDDGTGAVLYSTDRGARWQMLHDFGHPVVWLAHDPNNADRLYASVVHSTQGGVFVTDNLSSGAGASWRRLAVPPRTEGHPFNVHVLNDGTLVATYSGRRADGFTASSGVFVSTDGGTSWQDRSDSGMTYWTKDLVVDPYDAAQNTWYVAVFSGWGGAPNGLGGVYKTTDRGASWTRIVALDRVESVTIHPQDPDEMYVTTEYEGLWHTANLTSGNPSFSLVAAYPFQHPERVFYNPYDLREVWVTSFGNGLRVGMAQPATAVEADDAVPGAFVLAPNYPNPFNPATTIRYTLPVSGPVTLRVYDPLGRLVSTLVDGSQPAGAHTVRFDATSLPSGVYAYRLEAGTVVRTRTMILVK